jgi:NTE family protein
MSEQSPTAFVLSGGAALGAVQVGMVRALYERGVEPDLIVGTSVGAVNGAYLASRPFVPQTADGLRGSGGGSAGGRSFRLTR